MIYEGRNVAEPPEGHRYLIRIFYKNLTNLWQHPIPSPLARLSLLEGVMACK